MNNQLILLIEDDKSIRETLFWILSEEGYEVITASEGKMALELLEKDPLPLLIILDLTMPVLNGFEFREIQKNNCRLKKIPTLITSAKNKLDQIINLLPNEILLPKPFDIHILLTMIKRSLKCEY